MRRPLINLLIILAALGVLYLIAAGLGLTRGLGKRHVEAKSQMINDFERPQWDYDWTTGGYVQIEPSTENKTHGKYAAKATFLLFNQFYSTPTPNPALTSDASMGDTPTPLPTATPTQTPTGGKKQVALAVAPPASPVPTPPIAWRPEMVLENRSPTQLGVYEWQDYANLKLDVFDPQDQPVSWFIQIADSRGYVYTASGSLLPRKVNNLVLPLGETAASRIDLSNIRSFHFGLDLSGAAQPLVVYLDNLRLDGDAKAPKPVAVASPTPRR
ncbi:MAG TPA: hypothetical protein VHE12_00805 [bacterium]|nr:hypothetical protein [bacterium]